VPPVFPGGVAAQPIASQPITDPRVQPAQATEGAVDPLIRLTQGDGGAAPLSGPPPVPPPSGAPPLPPGVPPPEGGYQVGPDYGRPLQKGFWDKCGDFFSGGGHPGSNSRGWFQSDHCFDEMISPVTSPFFFEDPRSLTELRPIFLYQNFPKRDAFGGGNAEFVGLQGRLAFNEYVSLVVNKFGWVAWQPHHDNPFGLEDKSGFAEIWLGPKFTFYRNDCTKTVAAAGLTFEFPAGSNKVFQDTGTLGLDPYVSFGQTFGRFSYGSFDFMANAGYSFAVDDKRSEYLYANFHLDYNVGNLNKIYPLVELSWYHCTKAGKENDFITEGADLVNFGSSGVSGTDLLILAFGARYKFNEHLQTGAAVEWGLTDQSRYIEKFRLTLDMIFRW
jgi:hypothetical protein